MPSTLFRGAFVRYADLRCDDEAGKFIRLHLTADWTDTVRAHMGWQDVPKRVSRATLSGALAAMHMVLTPNGKELSKHELQLDITEAVDFVLVRQKDEEGEPKGEELRFMVRTNQAGAGAMIENYIERIGRGAGLLKITHEKQTDLDFTGGDDASNEDEKGAAEAAPGPALASKADVERASDPQRQFQQGQMDKLRAGASRGKGKAGEPVN